MKRYINMKTEGHGVETVDEFETLKETLAMLKEYRMSDPTADYYMSPRCTNEWRMDAAAQHEDKYIINGRIFRAVANFMENTLLITCNYSKFNFTLDQYTEHTGDMCDFIKRRVLNEHRKVN